MKLRPAVFVVAAGALTLAIGFSVTSSPAGAAVEINIPLDSTASGKPGEVVLLVESPVPPAFIGAACRASVSAENNSSVYPDNNLILTSGTTQRVLADVEGSAGKVTAGSKTVTLGDSIRVEMEFGPAGFTSGGLLLEVDCPDIQDVATTIPATTVAPSTVPPTAAPPTLAPSTTSTEPEPDVAPTVVIPAGPTLPAAQPEVAVSGEPTFTG